MKARDFFKAAKWFRLIDKAISQKAIQRSKMTSIKKQDSGLEIL